MQKSGEDSAGPAGSSFTVVNSAMAAWHPQQCYEPEKRSGPPMQSTKSNGHPPLWFGTWAGSTPGFLCEKTVQVQSASGIRRRARSFRPSPFCLSGFSSVLTRSPGGRLVAFVVQDAHSRGQRRNAHRLLSSRATGSSVPNGTDPNKDHSTCCCRRDHPRSQTL